MNPSGLHQLKLGKLFNTQDLVPGMNREDQDELAGEEEEPVSAAAWLNGSSR